MSYGQSRIQCEKDGASLASIHNEIEHGIKYSSIFFWIQNKK